jgi:hypothetical protein
MAARLETRLWGVADSVKPTESGKRFMRTISSIILAAALVMPNPLAAADNAGPLAPGKPSGVKQAQNNHQLEYILVGVSTVIAAGFAVILIKKYNKTSAAPAAAPAAAGASSVASATSS